MFFIFYKHKFVMDWIENNRSLFADQNKIDDNRERLIVRSEDGLESESPEEHISIIQ